MRNSILRISVLSIYAMGLLFSNTVSAASFDCSKATNQVEKLVCSDRNLSELDSKLGNIYRSKARSTPSAVADQRKWLHQQRNLCKTADCVRGAYLKRITELTRADQCPFESAVLIGGWIKKEGEGFEEIRLLSGDHNQNFLSWIHHKPEMVGRWTFENCTIHIQGLNDDRLQFDLEVKQLDKSTMQLRDMDADASSTYERANSPK